jgi:hypothetical protein
MVALAAGGDQVARVQRLDQGRGLGDPAVVGGQVGDAERLAAARPGLVGQLPGHDRRVVAIGLAGHAADPADQGAQVVAEQVLGLGVAVEARGVVGERGPGVGGVALLEPVAIAGPAQIGRHAARPVPEVVDVDHRLHAAPGHLGQHHVQALEQVLVIVLAGTAEGGGDRHLGRRGLARAEDAQVGHAHGLQPVQLAAQSGPVAGHARRAQPGPVPEVRADEAIGLAAQTEAAVLGGDEGGGRGGAVRGLSAAGGQGGGSGGKQVASRQHGSLPVCFGTT